MTINVFSEIPAKSLSVQIPIFLCFIEKRRTNTLRFQKKKDAPRKTGASSFSETSYEWNLTPFMLKIKEKHGPGTQILFCKPKLGTPLRFATLRYATLRCCSSPVARRRPLLLLGARARRGCARRARRQAAPAASPRAAPSPRVASSAFASSSSCLRPRRPLLRRLPTSLQNLGVTRHAVD